MFGDNKKNKKVENPERAENKLAGSARMLSDDDLEQVSGGVKIGFYDDDEFRKEKTTMDYIKGL
ncbi:MAG: hypothetical protein K6G42_09845 [Lachnospiraceae bacterium]|nr:hypothetical protein [Lachnospiraceae bacterium]